MKAKSLYVEKNSLVVCENYLPVDDRSVGVKDIGRGHRHLRREINFCITQPFVRNELAERAIGISKSEFADQSANCLFGHPPLQDIDRINDNLVVGQRVTQVVGISVMEYGISRRPLDVGEILASGKIE